MKRKYHVLWKLFGKNLWKNRKKFFLFFFSTFLLVTVVFVLVLLRDVLYSFQSSVVRLDKGMNGIMIHGMVVIAIVTAISLVISLRTYIASRRKDYELLRVLGIPTKIQRCLKLVEYVGSMAASALFGALTGTMIVYGLRYFLSHFVPGFEKIKAPGSLAYLIAAGVCLLTVIVCLIINNEVVIEAKLATMNRSAFEKSTMLPASTKWVGILGIFFVGISAYAYLGFRDFGEGTFYIIGLVIGVLILWIFFGGFFFRKKQEKCVIYPAKMVSWNAFYHRYYSKSIKRFLMFVLTFFLLFYYALQVTGSIPVQLGDREFPYQFVLKTRTDDETVNQLIKIIQDKYHADTTILPAVNVVSARGDEFIRDAFGNGNCGQSIGIPESVYQKFTGRKLGLSGEEIHIVFQQLSSDKAHPIDYATIGECALHFGSAYTHAGYLEPEELFRPYKIKGSERKILFGYWGKGYNENIVVFSDSYFQKITEQKMQEDLNKKWGSHPETDTRINLDKPEQAENYPDSLVLINVNKSSMPQIEVLLQEYEKNVPFEKKIQYLYDETVDMYYNSNTVIQENAAERTLKLVTCGLQFVFLLFVMLYLVYLNMNEDYEMKKRQFEFLRCLGLTKKQAADAVLFESGFTAFVPFFIGSAVSLIYVVGIGKLRLYTGIEWKEYLITMGGIWCVTYLIYFLVYRLMRKRMERQIIL